MARVLAAVIPFAAITWIGVHRVSAATIFTESFANNSVPDANWIIGGNGFTPCLTASGNAGTGQILSCAGTADGAGSGALRLTTNANSQDGFLFYNTPLPATAGLDITFDQYQYNGSGADGIAFFLTDGAYQLAQPGAFGGYLGYAGGNSGIGNGPGVAHGLFGIGLDAYGNFSNFENTAAADGGNCPAYTPVFRPNYVVLRGPGNADKTGYCHLAGAAAPSTLHVDSATDRTHGGSNDVVRKVNVVVDPVTASSPKVTVSINGTQVLQAAEPAVTSTVKFGWTASTGGSTNIHEIRNLTVATINPLNPQLTVSASPSNGGVYTAGGSGSIQYTVGDSASANFEPKLITLSGTLPVGLTLGSAAGTGWNCSTSGQDFTCTYSPSGYGLAPGTSAPPVTVSFTAAATYSHKNAVIAASATSSDGGTPSANSTVQVNPVANGATGATTANVAATLSTGTPTGTSPFTYAITAAPNPGLIASASFNSSGVLSYTPVSNASGKTSLQYTVTDPSGAVSAPATVTLSVAPVAQAVNASGTGPAALTFTPSAPIGSGPFTWALDTTPPAADGVVTITNASNGTMTFTPAQGFSGAVPTFLYHVADGSAVASSPASIDLTITKPAAPTVSPVLAGIDANTSYSGTVPGPSGAQPFTYTITTPPPTGSESINSSGLLTFAPRANTSGVVSSQYAATDQYGQQSSPGNVQITVRPVAANFSDSFVGGSSYSHALPAPVGSGPFTYVATPPQSNGPLSLDPASGQITFTPTLGYTGTTTFAYTVSDGTGTVSTPKTVTLSVNAPPPPVAAAWGKTADADMVITGQTPTPTSGTAPFTYTIASPPSAGSLALKPGGGVTYTPAPGFSGVVTWTYQVTDAYNQASAPAAVTFTYRPTAPDLTGTTTGPQPITVAPPPGSIDGTGPFSYAITQPAAGQGTASVDGSGNIHYTPPVGFSGVAGFTYTVTGNGGTTSNPAGVLITVQRPAPPVANPLSLTTVSGGTTGAVPSAQSGVGPLTWALASSPTHGTATRTGAQFDYTSSAPNSGPDGFTFTVTDAYGQTSTPATASVAVHPIAQAVSVAGTGPGPIVATPPGPQGTGPFSCALTSMPPSADGTATVNPSTCTIAFTPALGFVGAVPSFAYEVKDAAGLTSAPATVSITVIKPATPAAADISATTPVNTLISLTPTPPSGAGPFIFSIVSGPAGGAATINPTTGAITYAPATDVSGVDHLSYRVTDQYGQASPAATATITVMPLAQAAATAGVQGSPLTITMPAPTGTGPFTCALVPSSLPPATEGTVTMTGCTATFTPAATYSGTLAVQYRVTDAAGVASASQPITFAVSAHNTTSAAGSPPHLANAADPSGLANPDTGAHLDEQARTGAALVATGLLLLVVAAIAAWRRRREDRDGAR